MIVTFFNASGIDFGNFLNAHLKSKRMSTKYLTFTAMTQNKLSLRGAESRSNLLFDVVTDPILTMISVDCFVILESKEGIGHGPVVFTII
jgi:hypothetical protein